MKDLLRWLGRGLRQGQLFFWLGCAVYGAFCLMLAAADFAAVGVSAAVVLTLAFVSFGEASVGFAGWIATNRAQPHADHWALWNQSGRGVIAAFVIIAWILMALAGGAPASSMLLMAAMAFIFGIIRTPPDFRLEGRWEHALLIGAITVPCLVVAATARALGV